MIDTTATLRGLTIGAGTSYRWATWPEGPWDTPEIRVGDEPLAQRNGVQAGSDFYGGTSLRFDVWVLGSTKADAESKLAALAAAFARSDADVALDLRLSGTPAEYRLYGRPRGLVSRFDRKFLGGTLRALCSFRATDPLKYSTTLQTASTGLPVATGGLTFPATAPFVFGSGGSGSTMTCQNDGTADAPWTATFTGPLVAPELVHAASGKRLTLSGANLATGDSLVLDSKRQTVLLNGTASRFTWLTTNSQWFDLSPGSNAVALNGASGSGSVQLAWRSTWA